MLFGSYPFAVFMLLVWSAYWLIHRHRGARVWLLLAASYVFYGYWDWRFLFLILGSTVLDYTVGLALSRSTRPGRRRLLLTASLCGNLGALAFFKYWGFFTEEAARLLESVGLAANVPTLEILLPVGISFYTFQTLSYTIDIYRGLLEPERRFAHFALFVAFFPQLVAGPIVRARDFLPQVRLNPVLTRAAFESGLALFFWGLLKKIVIADFLGRELVDPTWRDPGSAGGWVTLLAIYGYALQIYGDFSGYSDCAIGVARMLGYELPRNFDAPYRAVSPRDFWRRWHISLSTWLRDYLYIGLGGNRGSAFKVYRNLMLTMALGGLWHGASWVFVLWGVYHGLLLVFDRLFGLKDPEGYLAVWARRLVMFHLVCLGWVFFRSPTLPEAWALLGSLFAPAAEAGVSPWIFVALAFGFATQCLPPVPKERVRAAFLALPSPARGAAYALLLGLLMTAFSFEQPFIYFQF